MTPRERDLLNCWTIHVDAHAFETLVSGYSGLVYSACNRILCEDTSAQDATQECFLQLAHKTPIIQTSLATWSRTVASRLSVNRVRQDSRIKNREDTYPRSHDTTTECT